MPRDNPRRAWQQGTNAAWGSPPKLASLPVPVVTIGLLIASNVVMAFAWYGRPSDRSAPRWTVILVSGGIAVFEQVLMVPANRIGHRHFSAAELKTIQVVITLIVFAGFSVLFLKELRHWNHAPGFAFIVAGAFFIFHQGRRATGPVPIPVSGLCRSAGVATPP